MRMGVSLERLMMQAGPYHVRERRVNLDEALRARRSVRAYLDKPVPDDALDRILRAAQTAPSWCNIQPWRVWVTRGEKTRAVVDAMLARLQRLSDDHFNAHPDEINWGHVGTLNHYVSLLRQITDSAFKEGEHAE